jgi:hypothetical protein
MTLAPSLPASCEEAGPADRPGRTGRHRNTQE